MDPANPIIKCFTELETLVQLEEQKNIRYKRNNFPNNAMVFNGPSKFEQKLGELKYRLSEAISHLNQLKAAAEALIHKDHMVNFVYNFVYDLFYFFSLSSYLLWSNLLLSFTVSTFFLWIISSFNCYSLLIFCFKFNTFRNFLANFL